MATIWKHYSLKHLVEKFGDCTVDLLHGLRCSNCNVDFHLDRTPRHCPACGESFIGEASFGVRLPEKIRDDQILAMLKELKVTTDQILSLAQQESQDIAALKTISQAVAQKVRDAAQRMNDAIAALKAGTVNAAQLDAIASELANHHNDLATLADALNSVGATADAEQPPADPTTPPSPSPGDTTSTESAPTSTESSPSSPTDQPTDASAAGA